MPVVYLRCSGEVREVVFEVPEAVFEVPEAVLEVHHVCI